MAEQLYYVRVSIGRLPLLLSCLSNENVVLQYNHHYPSQDIVDFSAENIVASFSDSAFMLFSKYEDVLTLEEEYEYGAQIEYKNQPLLLKWLQAQNLPYPLEKND